MSINDLEGKTRPLQARDITSTRIRDNQRRSRARKKEYVNELEEKYRTCQQYGAEASATIQHLARSVLEENKRLRALLHLHGIFDDEIGATSVVQDLQSTLESRSVCSSVSSTTAEPVMADGKLNAAQHAMLRPQIQTLHPSVATHSAIRRPDSLVPSRGTSWNHDHSPTLDPTETMWSRGQQSTPFSQDDMQQLTASPSDSSQAAQSDQVGSQPGPKSGSTACNQAALLLKSSFPHLDHEPEQDLCCKGPLIGCEVPNNRVFDLVDKYTSGDISTAVPG